MIRFTYQNDLQMEDDSCRMIVLTPANFFYIFCIPESEILACIYGSRLTFKGYVMVNDSRIKLGAVWEAFVLLTLTWISMIYAGVSFLLSTEELATC